MLDDLFERLVDPKAIQTTGIATVGNISECLMIDCLANRFIKLVEANHMTFIMGCYPIPIERIQNATVTNGFGRKMRAKATKDIVNHTTSILPRKLDNFESE